MALNENPTLQEIVDEVERLNNLIVNRGGARTITPKTSNQTLNKGYYKGNITVKGDANLIASNILSGKTIFGVNGNVVAGKRWATGSTQSYGLGSHHAGFEVRGLAFKPKFVLAMYDTTPVGFLCNFANHYRNYYGPNLSSGWAAKDNPNGSNYEYGFYSDGFRIRTKDSSTILCTWIAYE